MSLTTEQLSYVEQRLANDKKSALVAYLLWFFLSFLGAHRFYLGKRFGILFIVLFVVSIATFVIGVGIVTIVILFIWVIIDAFRIPSWITQDMEAKRTKLIAELAVSTAEPPKQLEE